MIWTTVVVRTARPYLLLGSMIPGMWYVICGMWIVPCASSSVWAELWIAAVVVVSFHFILYTYILYVPNAPEVPPCFFCFSRKMLVMLAVSCVCARIISFCFMRISYRCRPVTIIVACFVKYIFICMVNVFFFLFFVFCSFCFCFILFGGKNRFFEW